MKKFLILATALMAGSASMVPAYAQDRGSQTQPARERPSAQDLTSLSESRIAALHGGLRLTPDQEKLWPPLEAVLKEVAQARIARMAAMRPATPAPADAAAPARPDRADAMAMLNASADRLARRAERDTAWAADLRKIATAATPLYQTLDPAQKRWMRTALRDQVEGALHRAGHGKRAEGAPARR